MLQNGKREKIELSAGCKMVFNLENKTIALFDKEGGGRIKMLDDDKVYFPNFLSNEAQCIDLAIVIGRTHGLGVGPVENNGKKIKLVFVEN